MSPELLVSAVHCRREDHPETDACSYRVAWRINPHMRVGTVDPLGALWQHCAFVRLLEDLGARTTRLPYVHGAHDSVFTKDNAIVVDDAALLAHPAHVERRAEQTSRAEALLAEGIRLHAPPKASLEGGDVVILPGVSGALLGHGYRSTLDALPTVEAFLNAPVTPVELRDPRLYHLDMAPAVLSCGTALVCEEAITEASFEALRRVVKRVVRVPLAEALAFGVNLVELGRHVVLGGEAPTARAALRELGYATHQPRLDQFHLAGGSAACLVSRRHRSRTALRSTRAA